MATRTLTQLASRLRRESTANGAVAETDRELLTRFLREQDEAAFESLVRRHDRLVRSAIAKVLSDPHNAEDAFQATFFILVRRAKSIEWHAGLGPWLYGVAHRVAVKARDAGRTRTRMEQEAREKASSEPPDLSWREACALLHAELDKLPDRYRLPLLLCYLEGKTRDEAAAALKVSPGTVKGRLERGRDLLRGRLARRGVALSAGLLAAVAGSNAWASSPSSVSAVSELVRGPVPARVLALTRETAVSTILSKMTKTLALILGLAAASALLAAGSAKSPGSPGQKEKVVQPPAKAAIVKRESVLAVGVVVKKPDGKPAAGTGVWVWADGKKQAEGKADADGRADLSLPKAFEKVTVVATATGFAPDWADVALESPAGAAGRKPVELTLAANGGAIEARFTDLEGRPLANLPVEILRLAKLRPGQTWADFRDKQVKDDYALQTLPRVRAAAVGMPKEVRTDKDGRVKITGVGKDQLVSLCTAGQTHEYTLVRVVCRELAKAEELPGDEPLCGSRGTVHIAPARTITGTVRDAKTGDPVPGMKVTDMYRHLTEAITDKDGKFTLYGIKKQDEYAIAFGSLGEAPYFDLNERIPDSPGFEPLVLDVKASRGVVTTGRVTDDGEKPLRGSIFYHWTSDNPFIGEYSRDKGAGYHASNWGELDADGRYKLLVIPGKGLIGVCATPDQLFPRLNARKETEARKVYSWPVAALHAIREVDIDPKDAKTLANDFTLTAGKSRSLEIRGDDGKLPDKLLAVGHTEGIDAKPVAGNTIKLTGLSEKWGRAVILMDEAKTVGAVAAVTRDAETPLAVTLEKLGSITGRVFDADGKPAADAEVTVWLVLDRDKFDNLPDELFASRGVYGIAPGAWQQFTGRTTKADKDGRFTIPGLLPGQKYRLAAGFKMEKKDGELLYQHGLTVKPGETKDLGDLAPKK